MVKKIILISASILTIGSTSIAAGSIDENQSVRNFVKNIISEKTQGLVEVKKVEIEEIFELEEADFFEGYRLKIETSAKDPETGKEVSQMFKDIIFVSEEGMIIPKLYTKEGVDAASKYLSDPQVFQASKSKKIDLSKFETGAHYYSFNGKMIEGAKNLVFISDPLCPACRDFFSKITDRAKGKYNLFIVDFPLDRIHPASKYMLAVRNQMLRNGGRDILKILYQDKKYIALREMSEEEEIISFLEKSIPVKINVEELRKIDMPKVMRPYEDSESMGIKKRTPALFLDGREILEQSL